MASATPSRSSLLASGSRLSGTCERVIVRTAIASGMLMKKPPAKRCSQLVNHQGPGPVSALRW